MTGYKVDIEQICEEQKHSNEEFGDWSSRYKNNLLGLRVVEKEEYADITAPFTLAPGLPAFLVWFEYSTGDSFGCGLRDSVEAVGLFKTIEPARELAKAIREFKVDTDVVSEYTFFCKTSDGQEFRFGYPPWIGCFEHLEEVHVEAVALGYKKESY